MTTLRTSAPRLGAAIDTLSALGVRHTANLAYYRALSPLAARRTNRRVADLIATMSWVEHAVPEQDLTITVVLCTRNRSGLLDGAVESVRRQWHRRWQLVIVNDGSTDATDDLLPTYDDERITVTRTTGVGLQRARNIALELARGDVIAYVDDDNRLHPCWLKTLAWAFQDQRIVSAFGARVMDGFEPVHGCSAGAFPGLQFPIYDRRRQQYANAIDIGSFAHRPIPNIWFDTDERIKRVDDWDFIRRIATGSAPIALPVVACFYATTVADRLSSAPTSRAALDGFRIVSERHRHPERPVPAASTKGTRS